MGKIKDFWSINAKPQGSMGRMMLHLMNITHSPAAKQHLSLIDFDDRWTILDVGCGGGKNI